MSVKYAALWELARMAYRSILRGLLVKAVQDDGSDWDDFVLELTDRVFGYEA